MSSFTLIELLMKLCILTSTGSLSAASDDSVESAHFQDITLVKRSSFCVGRSKCTFDFLSSCTAGSVLSPVAASGGGSDDVDALDSVTGTGGSATGSAFADSVAGTAGGSADVIAFTGSTGGGSVTVTCTSSGVSGGAEGATTALPDGSRWMSTSCTSGIKVFSTGGGGACVAFTGVAIGSGMSNFTVLLLNRCVASLLDLSFLSLDFFFDFLWGHFSELLLEVGVSEEVTIDEVELDCHHLLCLHFLQLSQLLSEESLHV